VEELHIQPDSRIIGQTLEQIRPRNFGVNVLGVVRAGGAYVGAPRGNTTIEADDTLILYGEHGDLLKLLNAKPTNESEPDPAD